MIAVAPHRDPAVPADVHLVRVDLDLVKADASLDAPLFGVLSADERAAAARFRHPADALRFAAARAVLRREIGAALEVAPASLGFVRSERGRPALAGDGPPPLDFNLSHSGDHALVAWSAVRRVGVDVEARRPGWDWAALGPAVLGGADAALIAAEADADARATLFYDVWVAKEALLKAEGLGIAAGLNAFSVLSTDRRRPAVAGGGSIARTLGRFDARWLNGFSGHAACLAWSVATGIGPPPVG